MAATDDADGNYVVGIIENRAKEVGMAALDLRSASLHLNQYIESSRSYQNTMTLLRFFDPETIIIPSNTLAAPEGVVGAAALAQHSRFSAAVKVPLARGCFDDVKGSLWVQTLATKDTSGVNLDSYHKQYYLCLGAAAAILKWVENEKGVIITGHSLQVTFNGSFSHLAIDATSIEALEVIESLALSTTQQKQNKGSLFGVMNSTKTSGGSRLLKANLLQPLKDIETINTRLDCLDELTSNETLYTSLSQMLLKFPKDLDRGLTHFAFKQRACLEDPIGSASTRKNQALVSSIIILKEALAILPQLAEVLSTSKCSILRNIRETVCLHPNFDTLRERIDEVIDEEVMHARAPFIARTQQCFAVKAGFDGFLDVARRTFCDTSEAIHALGKAYREDLGLPNLKLPFNSRRGFYISIPVKDTEANRIPSIFLQVTKHNKNIHCTSVELTSLNIRNKEASSECFMRSNQCLEGLRDSIRQELRLLSLLSESVSLLDMVANSFTFLVSTSPDGSYVRPELTESGPLAIDGGRHPIAEKILQEPFVPNNTFLSEASNMMIVTGPNMSGKSTYLRQIALITIMGHIGMYVPARFASFRVVDHIFTRLGSGDNLEANSSTFMTEMRETAYLIQNLTSRSLVIVDELGRATSTLDGLAIAWSCSEYLLSLDAYVVFATHMQRLGELSSMYPNVKVCYFSTGVVNNRLDFKHVLKEGYTNVPHYGLLLAEVAGFPANIIAEARRFAQSYDEGETRRLEQSYGEYSPLRKHYQIAQKLLCLRFSTLDSDDLLEYLTNLKNNYLDGFTK